MRPPLSNACVSDGDAARGSGHRYRSEASSDRSRIFDFDAQLLRCGRERPQRCAKLAFLRFLSDRLPPDHAQPSRARPYFAVHQVRSLAFRLQVRRWHGHRAHPGASLTALQDEAGRHRSDDCSPSSRSAAAEGARTASQLGARATLACARRSVAICVRSAVLTLCCYRAQGGVQSQPPARCCSSPRWRLRRGWGRGPRHRPRRPFPRRCAAQGRRFSPRRLHER